ncbi:MAG: hypothetical protein LBT96_05445 [Campylobacteraceae bacterium]|jgi:hypothetical protein|nr:hypothetical protein [Campylobacteraceae bacterium]
MAKKDKDNNVVNGIEADNPPYPFTDENDTDGGVENETYTRTELENKTAKELAVIASDYITASPETIAKWAKKDIITVILNKGYDKKSAPRQNRTRTDTENVVLGILDFLDGIKEEREQKKLYKPLKEVVKNNAVNVIDGSLESGAINLHTASKAVLILGGFLILVDSVIGFKKIPELIKRWKEKRGSDKNDKKQ